MIDDDQTIRESQQWLLEVHGYIVRTHASAEQFLGELKPSDCLLVDHHTPGMMGLDLLEDLRARGDFTPAVIITGRTDPSIRPGPKNVA